MYLLSCPFCKMTLLVSLQLQAVFPFFLKSRLLLSNQVTSYNIFLGFYSILINKVSDKNMTSCLLIASALL